ELAEGALSTTHILHHVLQGRCRRIKLRHRAQHLVCDLEDVERLDSRDEITWLDALEVLRDGRIHQHDDLVADEAIRFDLSLGARRDKMLSALADRHRHDDLLARPLRETHALNAADVDALELHLCSGAQTRHAAVARFDEKRVAEQKGPVRDGEKHQQKQKKSADDDDSDACLTGHDSSAYYSQDWDARRRRTGLKRAPARTIRRFATDRGSNSCASDRAEELLQFGMIRLLYLVQGTGRHDAPLREEVHLIGNDLGAEQVMRDGDRRDAPLLLQANDQLRDGPHRDGVQARRGLIVKED